MEIKNICVHHMAGNLTLKQTSDLHRSEWPELPSELRPDLWVGYNFIVWKDGSWIQTRYIGEETAAQKGHNFDTVSICLAGDFTYNKPTLSQQQTLVYLIHSLVETTAVFKTKPGTVINIQPTDIFPHRVLQPFHTQCYGNSLNNSWARELAYPVNAPKPVLPKTPQPSGGPTLTSLQASMEALLAMWLKVFGTPFPVTMKPVGCVKNVKN